MSLIGLLKSGGPRLPRVFGDALARIPYEIRGGYGRDYRESRNLRKQFEEADDEWRRQSIFERVRRIVEHAVANTSFYRNYYASQGFDVRELRGFDDIERIPIVSKELLRDAPLEERSCRRRGRTLTYTGGSTGEPFQFYSDAKQIGSEWAHMHYIWSTLGFKQGDLLLTASLDETRGPVFYDALRHSIAINIHYPRDVVARALSAIPIRKRRPIFYRGYPTAFADFLEYCESNEPQLLDELKATLRGSLLASEFPLPIYRDAIERITEKPTISWYGLSERVVLAWERSRPFVYEPMQSYSYCETSTDSSGFTSLVGTAYYNFASPMIRYRIDDGINPLKTENGLLKAFEIHEGRIGDYLVDLNGEKFSITHLNLSCREETWAIARCIQIEQREPGKAIIWVVPKRETNVKELAEAFAFDEINLECEFRIIDKPFVSKRGKTLLKVDSTQIARR